MTSDRISRIFTLLFIAGFFIYLFGPLVIMGTTAFNSSSFPRVSPWECFSIEWFDVLVNDRDLMTGLKNSFFIGIGVIFLALPLGLAGALMLTQVSNRYRPWYYTIVISPILIPGVVLGISTLVFWDRLGRMFNADYDSVFYDGIFLTIIGQTTFIAAYMMLIFISRLQRFDTAQEEAALDLGATHVQTFRKILLPFLRPAIGSAAVLGFLASFENYNTTVFTISAESTLTTVLASKVRYGINPSISALAVIIIVITLFGAIVFEVLKRREEKYSDDVKRLLESGSNDRAKRANLIANPMLIITVLIFIAGFGTVYFSGTVGVKECKIAVKEQKRIDTERKIREFRAKRMQQLGKTNATTPGTSTTPVPAAPTNNNGWGSIFAPGNLEGQVDSNSDAQPAPSKSESFGNIFAPSNLEGQVDSSAKKTEQRPSQSNSFGNIFAPSNMQGQVNSN